MTLSMLVHTRLTLHVSHTYGHKESADLRVAYSHTEAFALPTKSNKQQEAYADMTLLQGIKPQRGAIQYVLYLVV
ncbi:MAG TPA: hypothetical protein DIW36_00785 [Ruminococcaceae bacterium]|nr:hypothetical protein [Oscillospiraceae bacterium]